MSKLSEYIKPLEETALLIVNEAFKNCGISVLEDHMFMDTMPRLLTIVGQTLYSNSSDLLKEFEGKLINREYKVLCDYITKYVTPKKLELHREFLILTNHHGGLTNYLLELAQTPSTVKKLCKVGYDIETVLKAKVCLEVPGQEGDLITKTIKELMLEASELTFEDRTFFANSIKSLSCSIERNKG